MKIRRLRKFRKPRTGELLSFETRQYYVTDTGLVYDGDRHSYVSQREKLGYMHVGLRDDYGKWHTTIKVHNLVSSVFQRLLNKGENVHHINHDRKNNNLSNLEIIDGGEHTRQHNYEKWMNGTMKGHGEKLRNIGNSYRPAKKVAQLDMDGRVINVWPSTQECERNGYGHSAVGACCRNCFNRTGKNVYKGFKWMWLEDYIASQDDKAPVTAPAQFELNFTDD